MRARRSAGWSRPAVLVALVAVAGLLAPLGISVRRAVDRIDKTDPGSVLDRLPLAFEANHGQFDPAVRFLARSPGQDVLLTRDGLSLSPSGVALTLAAARDDIEIEGREPLPGVVSRFVGDDPASWTSGAITFGSVVYRQVYPGVDVVFHGRGRYVEHDFVVAAGTDPGTIRFSVDGVRAHIDDRGDLVLPAAGGDLRLRAPELYQEHGDRRRPVQGAFEWRGGSEFGFSVGEYDAARPLVIDPVLVSASYLGGSSTDTAYGVATDADGHLVLTGYTESSDFQTLNPAQPSLSPNEGTRTDIFVSKVRADGSSLLWSTYLGGKGRDAALAVAVGPDGSAYLTGYTESNDFPLARPIRNRNSGGSDVFVVKLNPAGSAVDFATYIGGGGTDTGNGIAVDPSGGVFVAGTTGSSNFTTVKPFQPALSRADDQDAFILKLEPDLGALAWSSYLGGGGDDHGIDVTVDREGNAYLTGDTKSTNFPVNRPFQPVAGGSGAGVGGSFADAFVAKVNADGSGLVYASYLGGSDSDKGSGIAVDAGGNAYVAGNTGSSNFPVVNAAQPRKDGDFDAFVAKVKPDGAGLAYSTYLGGSGSDGAEGVVVDGRGVAHVVGATASTNFPTEKPFQPAKGGGFVDGFVTEVAPSGDAFTASSYLGGRDDDQAAGVALDRSGHVAVVGYTNSADFPIAKPFQPGRGGGVGDAFVTKVRADAAAESPGRGAAASPRDRRVRLLVTLTGLLFLAAILQSLWLRRRRARVPEPPPGGGAGRTPEREPLPGVAYTPRQPAQRQDDRLAPEREEQPVGPRSAGDPVTAGWPAARPGRPEPDQEATQPAAAWGTERSWRRSPAGPGWDLSERPLLRPLERAPATAEPARMPAPDLWEPPDAEGPSRPEVVVGSLPRRPAPAAQTPHRRRGGRAATRPAAGDRRQDGRSATRSGSTLELDPDDTWGPLNEPQDPGEWAEQWGLRDAPETAPATEDEPWPVEGLGSEPEVEARWMAASAPPQVQPRERRRAEPGPVAPAPPPEVTGQGPPPEAEPGREPQPPDISLPGSGAAGATPATPAVDVGHDPERAHRVPAPEPAARADGPEPSAGPVKSEPVLRAAPPVEAPPEVGPEVASEVVSGLPSGLPSELPAEGAARSGWDVPSEVDRPPTPGPAASAPTTAPAPEEEPEEEPVAWPGTFPLDAVVEPRPEDWDAAVYEPPPEPPPARTLEPSAPEAAAAEERDPFAPPLDLSLDELLDEHLPIPESVSAEPGPESDRRWLDDLLDEEFPIPEQAGSPSGQAAAGPESAAPSPFAPPAGPAPAGGPAPAAETGETAETAEDAGTAGDAEARRTEPEEPHDEDFLPPPPERLLRNLFEPDPDDPLVKATRSRRGRDRDR